MSNKKTVDERVVSMQFDNRNFEKNVQTSMSTLEKLKQKLNLTGASKGLENVNAAAKKVDMSPLSKGVEVVRTKFSALEVMGVTALANITNSAVNAGKRVAESLTIAPIKTGFNEYELKMNSTQTIMASTGETLETVNKHLNELNEYSDKTIYSFQDMTQNIGKFTNAGVKLEDAVLAMKGISNEAAVSGANANEASRAMYNFAQALSVGYIQRIDWKSIELANMATVEFKDQLLEAAIAAGTVKKNADGMYTTLAHPDKAYKAAAMFTETLDDQWLTTEVLINTLKDYADEETEIGKKATKAATEVKTFTQMLDTLKESAQSGWAKTWELIFGDFEEGKTLWTKIGKVVGGVIDKMSNARNALVGNVMSSPWEKLIKKINDAGISTKDFKKELAKTAKAHGKDLNAMIKKEGSLEKVFKKGLITKEMVIETLGNYADGMKKSTKSTEASTDKLKYFQKVVNEVWRGDYKNGQERIEALTKAGYKYSEVQDLVNKTVDGHKLTLEDLSDVQLESVGYTKEQIKTIRELADEAKKTGTPLNELMDDLGKPSGKELLLESAKNFLEAITKLLIPIKEAWDKTFGGKAEGALYNILEGIRDLSEALIISEDAANNFKTIFEGLFAGLQVANWVIGGGLIAGIKILSSVLSLFGTNLLEVGSAIAEYIIQFRDWLNENTIFINSYDKIAQVIKAVIDGVSKCVKAFMGLDVVKNAIKGFTDAVSGMFGSLGLGLDAFSVDGIVKIITDLFDKLESWIKGIDDAENIGLYIVQGLAKGLQNGAKWVFDAIISLATNLIDVFCTIFGIESPSRVFMALGAFIISGLVLGLKSQNKDVFGFFKDMLAGSGNLIMDFGSKLVTYIKSLEIGDLIAMAMVGGVAAAVFKTLKILDNFSEGVKGFGKMCSGVGNLANAFAERINPKKNKFKEACSAIMQLAIAIAILAGSVYLLAQLDWKQLLIAIGALAALAVIVWVLAKAASNIETKDGSFSKLSLALLGISASLYVMGAAIKKLEFLDRYNIGPILIGFGAMIAGLTFMLAMFGKFVKGKAAQNIDKAGWTILKISAALLLMTFVVKQIAKLDESALTKGGVFVVSFSALCVGLVALTKLAGKKIDSVGKMLLSIAGAMLLMIVVIKLVARMEPGELFKGVLVIAALSGIMVGLVAMTKLVGGKSKSIAEIGKTIMAISAAMLLMAVTIRIISGLSYEALGKGLGCITILSGIIVGLIAATKLAGKNLKNIAITMIAISGAIALLGLTAMILSLMSIEGLAKGIIAVSLLSLMMMGLIRATEKAKNAKGSLIALTVAIGVLGGLLIGLSFIDPVKLATATGALSAVIGMFALLVYVMQYLKAGEKTWKRNLATIAVLTLVVAALAGVIVGMSQFDTQNAIPNAAALSLVMLALAKSLDIITNSKSLAKGQLSKMVGMLATLTGVLAGIGLVLVMMSALDAQNVIPNAAALSIVILALSGVAMVLSTFKADAKSIAAGALGMAALSGVLALVGLVLAMMTALKVDNAITNAVALAGLMVVLAGVAVAMGLIGELWVEILAGALGMAALAGVMALVGLVLAMMTALKVDNAMENAKALSLLLITMAAVCAVLAFVGPAALLGIPALYALTQFLLVFGAVSVAIGYLMDLCPQLEDFLDKGIDVFIKLAGGLGKMIGAFISGIAEGVMQIFPSLGAALSDFAVKASFFVAWVKTIDDKALKGVGILVAAIGALTVASFINGVMDFLPFGGSFAELGAQLTAFMLYAAPFFKYANDINPAAMTGIKTLAEAVMVITANSFMDGIFRFLNFGDSSMEVFARQLPLLGKGIHGFVTEVGSINDEQVKIAERAASIIKTLAKASSELPNTGGWLGDIVGNNDMGPWAAQLPIMATGIKDFITTLTSDVKLTGDSVKIAEKAAEVIKVLAEAAKEIPNAGGALASWIGDNDLSKWAEELPTVAKGIKGFITTLTTSSDGGGASFGEDQVAIAEQAAKVVSALAKAAKDVPNAGGYLADWIGDNDLSTWAENLPDLGKGVKNFANELGTFDEDKLTTINTAVKAVKILSNMSKYYDMRTDANDFSSFGDGMSKLAGYIVTFTDTIGTVKTDTIDSAVSKTNKLIKLAKSVAKTSIDSVSKFGNSLKSVAKDGVKGFVKAFTADKPVSDVKAAAKTLLNEFIDAAKKKKDDVNKAFEGIAGAAAKSIKTYDMKKKFKSAGKYCVEGFAEGMKNNTDLASKAGTSLGKAALKAAKEALDENSPSKEMFKIGAYAVDGFVNALNDGVSGAYSASEDMAEGAKKGLSGAISKIGDLLNGDFDSQPTITPVLDLSNVKSGANAIGGMLSGKRTLSIDTTNIGAVSSLMSRNQNGRNSADIVSAIKGLRKDMANMPRNSYNINGITYDDGSNVSAAVEALIRAARIEGRT